MLHQFLFLSMFLFLLPQVIVSPFVGVLLYHWLDNLPPDEVYTLTLIPGYIALITGALTFLGWLFREKKVLPEPLLLISLMASLLIWVNVSWLYALVPAAGAFEWDRTFKVMGFAVLTALMLSRRLRLEAFVWVMVLSAAYYAIPGAIKFIISGGGGGISTGEVVVAGDQSFFGDRVTFSVVLAMYLPFALYIGQHAILLPSPWKKWVKAVMFAVAMSFLLALIGTFARTALFAGGATLLMLALRSNRKFRAIVVLSATVLLLVAIAPENWFERMTTVGDYETELSAASRLAAWKWSWAVALEHPITGGGFGVFVLNAGSIPGRSGWMEAHNIFFQMMAAHGFIGFGLFCSLIVAVYRSSATVRKRVRHHEELAWAADLARATQIGLVAFAAGGMFVSIATAPFLYTFAALAVGTRTFIERELGPKRLRQPAGIINQPA